MAQVALPRADRRGRRRGARRTASWRRGSALGERRLVILGHHYQRDEVIRHADFTGDSFKLAQLAATRPEAEFIVFCGVHFMAESADILSGAAPEGGPARPERRLHDGGHGGDRPGRGLLGATSRRWSATTSCPSPT